MQDVILNSPAGCSPSFTVKIKDEGERLSIVVSKQNFTAQSFEIINRSHKSYLDLFEQLAVSLQLRLPLNRMLSKAPHFDVQYNEVLTENVHPKILYGYGDPAVLKVEEGIRTTYYLVVTSNDAPESFPLLKSENLVGWQFIGHIFPKNEKPIWAAEGEMVSDFWAPEMHKVADEYWLYFVARDKQTKELCIGKASSSHPEKPFTPTAEPLLTGNVIDPHVFVEDDGTAYLFWKEDNNDVWPSNLLDLLFENPHFIDVLFNEKEDIATTSFTLTLWPWAKQLQPMERFQVIQTFIEAVTSRFDEIYKILLRLTAQETSTKKQIDDVLHYMKTPMFAQQLSSDGNSLVGEKKKILENDLAWEAHLVEGMWMTKHNSKYYLFYAGNDFSTDHYGIGVAIANSPTGPFSKMHEPLLKSTAKWTAPGHPSVVNDHEGKHVMFLHAYYPGSAGYKQFRALLSIKLKFYDDRVEVAS